MEKNNKKNCLVIFAKIPDLGIAKSRIAATHGKKTAADIYNKLLKISSQTFSSFDHHISFTGNNTPDILRNIYPNATSFIKQKGKDLGRRLFHTFSFLFKSGYKNVCALGVDCPYITSYHIHQAYAFLNQENDVVIGPAKDGGYYLIGCNKKGSLVFNATMWSTKHLFAETIDLIKQNNLNHFIMETLSDIDYYKDYEQWERTTWKL